MISHAAHIAVAVMLGALALAWMVLAAQMTLGIRRLPRLEQVQPLPDSALPSISLLFSARNEAEKMPEALRSMLALDYPTYEIIAVDDRSTDGTGEILREFSLGCKHLRTVRVETLPAGWLGKPHGLQTAYERSSGEWLVFTDADVQFHPAALRRAVSLALERKWDHVTLFPRMEMHGIGEKIVISYFSLGGYAFSRAWSVPERESRAYVGVGAFQLVRRSAYQALGTHRRLAREVVDDMKLGKLVKEAGFVSGVALSGEGVRLRWQAGVRNIIQGTEKNFFAVTGFRLGMTVIYVGFFLLLSLVPFLALVLARGWALAFAGIAAGCAVLVQAWVARLTGASPLYGLTHPLGAVVVCFMLARSTALTLWNRGIYWRGTFYPLDDLRGRAAESRD